MEEYTVNNEVYHKRTTKTFDSANQVVSPVKGLKLEIHIPDTDTTPTTHPDL